MKKVSLGYCFFGILFAIIILGCVDPPTGDVIVSMDEISGLAPPASGEVPVSSISETSQYTGSVSWSPDDTTFQTATVYTATITLSAKDGFIFEGVSEDFFTVYGAASVTNNANSNIVTAVFPVTDDAPLEIVNITEITGLTPPAYGETPVLSIDETSQYAGTVSWSPDDNTFEPLTVYTATITLTAKDGHTFTGVAEDSFSVTGADYVANSVNSSVIIAVFPATGDTPPEVVDISEFSLLTPPAFGSHQSPAGYFNSQYYGSVTWSPDVSGFFDSEIVYTATITLTANSGYTFAGVPENFFTVPGAASVTNSADSNIVTAVFPATDSPLPGDSVTYSTSLDFNMNYVPGGVTFNFGELSTSEYTVDSAFLIADTEVTYELWCAVCVWAEHFATEAYQFNYDGKEGSHGSIGAAPTYGSGLPVTYINWSNAVVWCNALTEYHNNYTGSNIECAYLNSSGEILRNAGNSQYSVESPTAKGFRLPSNEEWELAARYIGDFNDDGDILDNGESYLTYWASGADASAGSTTGASDYDGDGDINYTSDVAWWGPNSNSIQAVGTAGGAIEPRTGNANALGLYDMSGNLAEFCNRRQHNPTPPVQYTRGGNYNSGVELVNVFSVYNVSYTGYSNYNGFRICRTVD